MTYTLHTPLYGYITDNRDIHIFPISAKIFWKAAEAIISDGAEDILWTCPRRLPVPRACPPAAIIDYTGSCVK